MSLPFANGLSDHLRSWRAARTHSTCVLPSKVRWNPFITAWTGGTLSKSAHGARDTAEKVPVAGVGPPDYALCAPRSLDGAARAARLWPVRSRPRAGSRLMAVTYLYFYCSITLEDGRALACFAPRHVMRPRPRRGAARRTALRAQGSSRRMHRRPPAGVPPSTRRPGPCAGGPS